MQNTCHKKLQKKDKLKGPDADVIKNIIKVSEKFTVVWKWGRIMNGEL